MKAVYIRGFKIDCFSGTFLGLFVVLIMTERIKNMTTTNLADMPFTEADYETHARNDLLASDPDEIDPENFPVLRTLPIGLIYQFFYVPQGPRLTPEYLCIRRPEMLGVPKSKLLEFRAFVSEWNLNWKTGLLRKELFTSESDHGFIPPKLKWILDAKTDVRLVFANERHNYEQYTALYHLLSRRTLEKFGLPLLSRGNWPNTFPNGLIHHVLPQDFNRQLEEALAYHLWPFLDVRGCPSAFSMDDPVKLLSHNLDYWMPFIDVVAQEKVESLGRVDFEDEKQRQLYEQHAKELPPEIRLERPHFGGHLWTGEDEARMATRRMIEIADKKGDLRSILDAVRSNRIKDDFSERWSYEREDFERKLYSKRNKIKVAFVELDETIPVHSCSAEVHENLLWQDFLALFDAKERRIVVCLRNGETRLGDIAKRLGYANHSAISKALARIRKKAKRFLE